MLFVLCLPTPPQPDQPTTKQKQAPSPRHKVLIVGGGSAGLAVAAQLRNKGVEGIGIVEPSSVHYYQPLWTLVGGGIFPGTSVCVVGRPWVGGRTWVCVTPSHNACQCID